MSPVKKMDRVLKILVVEDNPDDVLLLRQAFKRAGGAFILAVVHDGLEAKAYLNGGGKYSDRAAHPFPDLMMLDLNMPSMNGFEVLEWLRNHSDCKRLMVHVMTASPRESDIRRAYDLHANSYMVKPSRVDELVRFVKSLFEWHRYTALPRCSDDRQL
ncbi:MAG TPA: response regulator [Verrucomicrobiae bacterium]|jgi:CheY-like chemotaxis protein|nr:response regulator [Verrucomicrobiae bacterium]